MAGGKSALIFGASGVTGWAFVNEILNDYPKKGVWTKVHALTNRPLSLEDSKWPKDSRLNIVSGIDLLKGSQEELEAAMKEKTDGIEEVTHVYYLAYKANKDLQQELEDAVDMFKRSTIAVDHLSPKLEFVVLQTGAKMYGCHLLSAHPTDYIHVPLAESLPRLKPPYHDALFYHPQLDWLTAYAKNKRWNWCDTRPDIIIGFVPNQNFYSLGTVLGIYLSLYRAVEGEGADCPFPGTDASWAAKSNDSSSDMIARQTLHLSLTLPKESKGEGYNVADAKSPETWSSKWPQLCAYFGLKGTAPTSKSPEVRQYIKEHMKQWSELEAKHGLQKGHADSERTFQGFEYFLLTQFDFDRQYDMTKMYGTGFEEERSVMGAWGPVFERMKAAKIIP
ncbi:uncharacterized protein BDZ99DRAFT_432442 [Mytilinidion resinicola]|uniref:PRISE-like Rossmann-fold domain-containing protein n=1 Tax=Mytilinidion resinicola TaxID=574789 RepID=A0A6A6Z4Z8_9PEZI|nr:uncharacterized protein BDZ99DRAFT_432442 [Mytilinidion resinicola]KAF2815733.1 hypothetical protein BDZ99DRAFT_432442 [Mytilinidion resinicola]